ncbi:MAG: hypothetical protein ACPG06_02465 [Alphaproteobacteria bacterium]
MSQNPLFPPIGQPKAFPGTRDRLLRIAAGIGLYVLLVMYPAYLWLIDTVPAAADVAIAILVVAAYAAYSYRSMKRLALIAPSPKQDQAS